jgi:hypothetical protein
LEILEEILSYGIGGLFTPVKPFLTLFNWGMPDMAWDIMPLCTSHFLIDFLNRAVLVEKLVD